METQMRTLTKAIFGVAMLAGSALAIAPANAQSNFGFYFGNGVHQGAYGVRGGYEDRGGFWRWDPYLHRQVWIPARDFTRGREWDRDDRHFDRDRDDYRGWDRGYRGR
jgi:hypothetical protein